MELQVLLMFAVGAIVFFGGLAGIVLGIRRMQGHRSRFDGMFETLIKAQGAGVFPPSLRGNPDPLQQEVVEVDRGEAAVRTTPGEITQENESRPAPPTN
jgi:hypothetical protein